MSVVRLPISPSALKISYKIIIYFALIKQALNLIMFFASLEEILAQIEQQPGWEKYQEYCQVLECWQKIVNKQIAEHTRPLYITRQIFWVATVSSVWAQELSLQRYSLLGKLNNQLPFLLKDIRFSPIQGQQVYNDSTSAQTLNNQHRSHPSQIKVNKSEISLNNLSSPDDPREIVKHWLTALQKRSPNLFICPQCQSLTPEGELKRWNLCCHCVAQKWAEKDYSRLRNQKINNNVKNG